MKNNNNKILEEVKAFDLMARVAELTKDGKSTFEQAVQLAAIELKALQDQVAASKNEEMANLMTYYISTILNKVGSPLAMKNRAGTDEKDDLPVEKAMNDSVSLKSRIKSFYKNTGDSVNNTLEKVLTIVLYIGTKDINSKWRVLSVDYYDLLKEYLALKPEESKKIADQVAEYIKVFNSSEDNLAQELKALNEAGGDAADTPADTPAKDSK